jgi:hypothetical protein
MTGAQFEIRIDVTPRTTFQSNRASEVSNGPRPGVVLRWAHEPRRHARHAHADASRSGIHTGGEECAMPAWLHSEWRLLHRVSFSKSRPGPTDLWCCDPTISLDNRCSGGLQIDRHLKFGRLALRISLQYLMYHEGVAPQALRCLHPWLSPMGQVIQIEHATT